jgi:hypothetical protein
MGIKSTKSAKIADRSYTVYSEKRKLQIKETGDAYSKADTADRDV